MRGPVIALFVLFAVVLFAAGEAAYYYPRLPQVVATHFDATGRPVA